MIVKVNTPDIFDPRFEEIPAVLPNEKVLSEQEFGLEFSRLEDLDLTLKRMGLKPEMQIEEGLNQPFLNIGPRRIFCNGKGFIEFPLGRAFIIPVNPKTEDRKSVV